MATKNYDVVTTSKAVDKSKLYSPTGVTVKTLDLDTVITNSATEYVDSYIALNEGITFSGTPSFYKTVTVNSTALNTSFATPVTILAAPGANKMYWVRSVLIEYVPTIGTAVSTGGNATVIKVDSNTICSQDFAGITAYKLYFKTNSLTASVTGDINKALVLSTATANPTFYGSLRISLEYQILTTT